MARSGAALAGSALAGVALPRVHAAEANTIRLALIGCGGRGSGAAANAFDSPHGPVKLIAMADFFGEMNIHQIDEICWLKDAYPVSAHGIGGRTVASTGCGQGLDSFTIEWTCPDGTKAFDVVRWLPNCHPDFATYVHGTKCAAQFSGSNHEGIVHTYKDQRCERGNIAWRAEKEPITPWQAEWDNLLDAIRQDQPHNEGKRAALSNLADIMGRAAVHSGKVITWDDAMASNFSFCPNIDDLTDDSPPPVQADANGRYPVPVPGKWMEI